MNTIWTETPTLDAINARLTDSMCDHIGIEVIDIGADYLKATMPVDRRTRQYMGIVHGGASVALAETLGSLGGLLCCQPGYSIVGLDINANHIRAGRPPYLTATARPLHLGGTTMVWEIKIHDVDDKLVCISRLTLTVLKERPQDEVSDN